MFNSLPPDSPSKRSSQWAVILLLASSTPCVEFFRVVCQQRICEQRQLTGRSRACAILVNPVKTMKILESRNFLVTQRALTPLCSSHPTSHLNHHPPSLGPARPADHIPLPGHLVELKPVTGKRDCIAADKRPEIVVLGAGTTRCGLDACRARVSGRARSGYKFSAQVIWRNNSPPPSP